ncbi:hypothetical protein HDU96_004975, partial [Phlyctochytrium bullatum]
MIVAPTNGFVFISIAWFLTASPEKSKSFIDSLPSGKSRKDSQPIFPSFQYLNKVLTLDQIILDEAPHIAVLQPGTKPFEYEAFQGQTFNKMLGDAVNPSCSLTRPPSAPPPNMMISTEEVEQSYRVEILKRPGPTTPKSQRRLSDASFSPATEPTTEDFTAALDPRIRKLRTAREEEETLKRWKQRLSRYHVARRKIMKTPPEQLLKDNKEFRRRQRLGLPTTTRGNDTVLNAESADGSTTTTADDQTSKETADDWIPK